MPGYELAEPAMALAQRIAPLPDQLETATWALNAVADEQFDPPSSRRLGTFSTASPATPKVGLDFVKRSNEVGFRRPCVNGTGPSATTASAGAPTDRRRPTAATAATATCSAGVQTPARWP